LPKINCFAGYASIGNKIYVIGGTTSEPNWTNYTDVYEGTLIDNTSGINTFQDKPVKIYQTNKGQITISFNSTIGGNVKIDTYNMNGLLVYSKNMMNRNDEIFNVSMYPKGVYLVRVVDNEKWYNAKISID
jgi:hypothetical protein